MPEFLDTNVIIRHLTNDQPEQSARALAFLQEVEAGNRAVVTCEAVLAEAVYVLASKRLYGFSREDVRKGLSRVVGLRGLQIPHKQTYLRALDLYGSTNLDFADVLNVAHMERLGIATIVSFDRGFDRIPGISRREP